MWLGPGCERWCKSESAVGCWCGDGQVGTVRVRSWTKGVVCQGRVGHCAWQPLTGFAPLQLSVVPMVTLWSCGDTLCSTSWKSPTKKYTATISMWASFYILHVIHIFFFFYQQNVCIFPGSQNTGTGVKISFAEHHQFVLARATSLFCLEKIQVHGIGKPVMIVKCPYLSLYHLPVQQNPQIFGFIRKWQRKQTIFTL